MLGLGGTGRNRLDGHLHLDMAIETVEDGHQPVNVLDFLKRLDRKVTIRVSPYKPGEPHQVCCLYSDPSLIITPMCMGAADHVLSDLQRIAEASTACRLVGL